MVQATPEQLAQWQKNLNRNKKIPAVPANSPNLYRRLRAGNQRAQTAVGSRTPRNVRSGVSRSYNAIGRTPANVRRGAGSVRNAARTVNRNPVGRKVSGGFGAMLTLFIGTGVAIAVIKNPKIVSVPLAFIGNIFGAFTKLSQGGTAAGAKVGVAV